MDHYQTTKCLELYIKISCVLTVHNVCDFAVKMTSWLGAAQFHLFESIHSLLFIETTTKQAEA
jgi:hypothetical protein